MSKFPDVHSLTNVNECERVKLTMMNRKQPFYHVEMMHNVHNKLLKRSVNYTNILVKN